MIKQTIQKFLSYFYKVNKGVSFNKDGLSDDVIKKYLSKDTFYSLRTDTGVWELKGVERVGNEYFYTFYIIDYNRYVEISQSLFDLLFEPTKYNPLNIESFMKRDRNVSQ